MVDAAANSNTVEVAGIVAVSSILGPLLLSYLTNRQRRAEKDEDYARQDEVARKAQAAADKVAEVAKSQGAKLDQIHVLVNSNMTASMQGELDAYKSNLVLLEEISSLRKAAGQDPSPTTMAVIESTKKKISELDAQLADRLKNTQKADEVRRVEGG